MFLAYRLGHQNGTNKTNNYWKEELPNHRKDAIMRSRAVIGGQFSEQLAPYLPGFNYKPTECKFIGKPIDFIVFEGSDEKQIEKVTFLEIKSGNSKLTPQEKSLKETIEKGNVTWKEYRIDKELTK